MDLSFQPLALTLRDPFTISRGTQTVAHTVSIHLSDGDHTGRGEAAPSSHYGETQGTVLALLTELAPELQCSRTLSLVALHQIMDGIARLNPAAKAAVDIALHDLTAQRFNAPLYAVLGIDAHCTPQTSYTIGIDTPETMARKAAEARDFPILKVKVGTPGDTANLEAIRRERPDAIIRVDANEAWTAKQAVRNIETLLEYGLEFVEQPVPGDDLDGLDYVRRRVPLPVIADESCVVPMDVPRVARHVDGINIKLMKCGGIYPALQMIHLARAHHLQVMMGCMIESSLAITAAAQLSPLLDYADLDGQLLIDDDPYTGVTVEDGRLVLPDAPGLGIQPR